MEKMLLNLESGLLMKDSFQGNEFAGAAGKYIQCEVCEMNTVQVVNGDKTDYYNIIGHQDGLAVIEHVFDSVPADEIGSCWDQMHKKLWDALAEDLGADIINKMTDFGTAEFYGVSVEHLNRRLK